MIIDFLRDLKVSYSFYNFFKKSALEHNIPVYKKIGLSKKYYSSVSSVDFEQVPHPIENKATNLVDEFSKNAFFHTLSEASRQSLLNFDTNGYSIVSGIYASEEIDQINQEVDQLIKTQKVRFKYINKIMFAFQKSTLLKKMANKKQLLDLIEILLRRKPVLFQSINFIHGSEQATHSDSIHMTTYPLGNLIAAWVALEDISIEQGALHYYPKSHTLPYFLNKAFNNQGNWIRLGKKTYADYEKELALYIQKTDLTKEVFTAKKGDVLIWHANLLHGGEPHTHKKKTRKSMVLHFFAQGVVCYHEFTQRPALMKS